MSRFIGFKIFNSDWTETGEQVIEGQKYSIGEEYKSPDIGVVVPPPAPKRFHCCKDPSDCFSVDPYDPNNKVALVCGRQYNPFEKPKGHFWLEDITLVAEIPYEYFKKMAYDQHTYNTKWRYKEDGWYLLRFQDEDDFNILFGEKMGAIIEDPSGCIIYDNFYDIYEIAKRRKGIFKIMQVEPMTCYHTLDIFFTTKLRTIREIEWEEIEERFNSKINIFGKPSDLTLWEFINHPGYNFIKNITNGRRDFLHVPFGVRDWRKRTKDQENAVFSLPNFDPEYFKMATGIYVKEDYEKWIKEVKDGNS